MRILLVSDHYPPEGNGHAVAAAWWARVMGTDAGLRVQVLHPRSDRWRGQATLRGLDAPDLLHLHGHGLLVGSALRRFRKVPAIAHVHQFAEGSGAPDFPGLHALLRARQRSVLARARLVVAPSRHAAGRVRELLPEAQVDVLPTGLRPELTKAVQSDLDRLGNAPTRVLFVGRRSWDKGYPAFTRLAAAHPEVRWVAMGSGGGDTPGVESLPHGPPAEVALQVKAADVLLSPSMLETQGLAALEALSLGTPVVAPEGTAQAELVRRGVSGYLYAEGDLDDAWACIIAAASLPRAGVRPPEGLDEASLRQSMRRLYELAAG